MSYLDAEIKSIAERVERLEDRYISFTKCNHPCLLQERIEKLESRDHDERITDLENIQAKKRLINNEVSVHELEIHFKKLEKHVEQMTEHYLRKVITNAKPHKCPVCNGKPLGEIQITRTENGRDKLLIECHACEGKGIVWG